MTLKNTIKTLSDRLSDGFTTLKSITTGRSLFGCTLCDRPVFVDKAKCFGCGALLCARCWAEGVLPPRIFNHDPEDHIGPEKPALPDPLPLHRRLLGDLPAAERPAAWKEVLRRLDAKKAADALALRSVADGATVDARIAKAKLKAAKEDRRKAKRLRREARLNAKRLREIMNEFPDTDVDAPCKGCPTKCAGCPNSTTKFASGRGYNG